MPGHPGASLLFLEAWVWEDTPRPLPRFLQAERQTGLVLIVLFMSPTG